MFRRTFEMLNCNFFQEPNPKNGIIESERENQPKVAEEDDDLKAGTLAKEISELEKMVESKQQNF